MAYLAFTQLYGLNRLFVSLVANILLDWLHSGFDLKHVYELIRSRPRLYLISSGILFIVYSWFVSLYGSKFLASPSILFLAFVLGLTSHIKIEYRGEPLYPMELTMISEVPFILGMINWLEIISYFLQVLYLFI